MAGETDTGGSSDSQELSQIPLAAAFGSLETTRVGRQAGRRTILERSVTTSRHLKTGRAQPQPGLLANPNGYACTVRGPGGHFRSNFKIIARKIYTNRPSPPIGVPPFTVPNALAVRKYPQRRGKEDQDDQGTAGRRSPA